MGTTVAVAPPPLPVERAPVVRAPGGVWRKLDWVFGVIAPPLCLLADPLLFQPLEPGGLVAEPIWPRWRMPAYVLVGLEVAVLAVWLAARPRGRIANLVAAPFFVVGAFAALAMGIAIL